MLTKGRLITIQRPPAHRSIHGELVDFCSLFIYHRSRALCVLTAIVWTCGDHLNLLGLLAGDRLNC